MLVVANADSTQRTLKPSKHQTVEPRNHNAGMSETLVRAQLNVAARNDLQKTIVTLRLGPHSVQPLARALQNADRPAEQSQAAWTRLVLAALS